MIGYDLFHAVHRGQISSRRVRLRSALPYAVRYATLRFQSNAIARNPHIPFPSSPRKPIMLCAVTRHRVESREARRQVRTITITTITIYAGKTEFGRTETCCAFGVSNGVYARKINNGSLLLNGACAT